MIDFEISFDHSQINAIELKELGIRNYQELHEVFEDIDSSIHEITKPEDQQPTFFVIGFSKSMNPIIYIFDIPFINDSLSIRSLYARKANKEELKKYLK